VPKIFSNLLQLSALISRSILPMSTRAQPSFWLSSAAFSSSLSVIFSHTVTAISVGEKQAVFSDIISAARSREMVSSPDLQTFSRPTLASLLKPNLPYVQMIFPFAGSHRVIELPFEKTFIAHFAAQPVQCVAVQISRSGTSFWNGTFSTSAPVGQRDTHCPHEMHCESPSDL